MKGQPRLLFVAYPFRPLRGAGCVRTWNVAKHLARRGWEVRVLTPHPRVWRHVDNADGTEADLCQEQIGRLLTDHGWRWLSPSNLNCRNEGLAWLAGGLGRQAARHLGVDRIAGWIRAAERACSALTSNDVDVILASGPPFGAFTVAQRLSRRLGRPYVLDYRDLWSRNAHDPSPQAAKREASLLAGCAAVTTVSPSWGAVMHAQFGVGPKLHVISNGYDAEELARILPHDFGHFAIVYTGVFYPPKRVISPVMAALRRLEDVPTRPASSWAFHYYGRDEQHVRQEADRFGVTPRILLHGQVPRSEALSAVKGAAAAVVISSVAERATMEDDGIVTGKIFEAIGLRTPTLLIAPAGSDANAVAEKTGLACRVAGEDVNGIVTFLAGLMDGRSLKPTNPETYAWENIIEQLDQVLRGVVGPRSVGSARTGTVSG